MARLSPSRRISPWLVTALAVLLLAPSLQAQAPFRQVAINVGGCTPPPSDNAPAPKDYQALEPTMRLLYELGRPLPASLEIRFRVNGELRLTETVDLSAARLPQLKYRAEDKVEAGRGTRSVEIEEAPIAVLELLAFNPDTVRELHRLAGTGAAIEVEFVRNGVTRRTGFTELVTRTADLRAGRIAPVTAASRVSGPGVVAPPRMFRAGTAEYLPDCGDCTYDHPCDTECGYDPGKGGPVTCGEQGQPCQQYCSSSWYYDFWTDWSYYNSGYYNYYHCFDRSGWDYVHRLRYTTYRREKIRRTTTCPNSPSCAGCYTTDTVIEVDYDTYACWENTYSPCFNGDVPCCSSTCDFEWNCGGAGCY